MPIEESPGELVKIGTPYWQAALRTLVSLIPSFF
jgi:hypothetical protein